MDRVIGPYRAWRASLRDGLGSLQEAASALADGRWDDGRAGLERALAWVNGVLLPACRAEEFTLFPTVDGVVGQPGSCLPLERQHDALRDMGSDLAKLAEAAANDGRPDAYAEYLAALLYALWGVARVHLDAEDAVFLPMLDDHLSESQVNVLVENSERIVAATASS
ncbi:hemerythrin domain-containing protein [Tepidiforma sp.]|uniref:hemerythrin domain-containing protein n=1 Tax=Tepidiforma sp. TaxID=2682230 RepID=UPI002ADE5F64|nr:hemerythrin domain-containing protein [Tepidiforma sp.]